LNTLFFGGEEHCSSHGRRAKRAKEFPKGWILPTCTAVSYCVSYCLLYFVKKCQLDPEA
jgi:hypothetical protein